MRKTYPKFREFTALNGHNGSYYTLSYTTSHADPVRLETQKSDRFSFSTSMSRNEAARLLNNWRRDPAISVSRWHD